MPFDVFISYSNHDKQIADAVCARLESIGVRCWIAPRDIMPGAEYGGAIVEAIHQARLLVLVFSAAANRSPQIRREVERAVSRGVPVVPFRIEDIAPTQSLEYFIGTVHWLDALTAPIDQHLQRLGDAVQALLRLASPGDDTVPRPANEAGNGSVGAATLPNRWLHGRRIGLVVVSGIVGLGALAGIWYAKSVADVRSAMCEDLWISRNAYYKAHGLCFQTERAKKHFSNAGCSSNDAEAIFSKVLSDDERGKVLDLRDKERAAGCL